MVQAGQGSCRECLAVCDLMPHAIDLGFITAPAPWGVLDLEQIIETGETATEIPANARREGFSSLMTPGIRNRVEDVYQNKPRELCHVGKARLQSVKGGAGLAVSLSVLNEASRGEPGPIVAV